MRYSQKSDFLGGNYRDLLIKLFCINEVTQPFGFLTLVNIKLSDIYRPSKMNFYWYGKHGWEKYFLNLKMWSKCLISYRTGPSRSWRSLTRRIHLFYTIILKRKSPYHKILRSLKCQVIKNITFEDFQVDFDRFDQVSWSLHILLIKKSDILKLVGGLLYNYENPLINHLSKLLTFRY